MTSLDARMRCDKRVKNISGVCVHGGMSAGIGCNVMPDKTYQPRNDTIGCVRSSNLSQTSVISVALPTRFQSCYACRWSYAAKNVLVLPFDAKRVGASDTFTMLYNLQQGTIGTPAVPANEK